MNPDRYIKYSGMKNEKKFGSVQEIVNEIKSSNS